MSSTVSMWLGLAFVATGIVAASLQAWLWTFPMLDENTSSAPRTWTNVHRAFGYLFTLIYIVLMVEMVPRLWEYRVEFNGRIILHLVLGLVVAPVLISKILIIRRFKRFGGRLPWFGGFLCASAILLVGIVAPFAWKGHGYDVRPPAQLAGILLRGREVVATKCTQCHGYGTIISERRSPDDWHDVVEDMQEFSMEIPGKQPITDSDRQVVASYLRMVYSSPGKANDRDDGGRRRRRRGRDR